VVLRGGITKAVSPFFPLSCENDGGGCVWVLEMLFLTQPIMKKPHRYRIILPLVLIINFIFLNVPSACLGLQGSSAGIFDRIEKGILGGAVETFAQYLAPQVSISINGDRACWYSTNQAYSILKNYFGLRRTLSFAFTTRQES